jgi:hypothetical protein
MQIYKCEKCQRYMGNAPTVFSYAMDEDQQECLTTYICEACAPVLD